MTLLVFLGLVHHGWLRLRAFASADKSTWAQPRTKLISVGDEALVFRAIVSNFFRNYSRRGLSQFWILAKVDNAAREFKSKVTELFWFAAGHLAGLSNAFSLAQFSAVQPIGVVA